MASLGSLTKGSQGRQKGTVGSLAEPEGDVAMLVGIERPTTPKEELDVVSPLASTRENIS